MIGRRGLGCLAYPAPRLDTAIDVIPRRSAINITELLHHAYFFSPSGPFYISSAEGCSIKNKTMASRAPCLSIARRALFTESTAARASITCRANRALSNRNHATAGPRSRQIAASNRAFSTSTYRRRASEDPAFDPRQQEREVDQVDVCIVGGGTSSTVLLLEEELTPEQVQQG